MDQRNSDVFLQDIRSSLKLWKQTQLVELTKEAQETMKLNDYIQMASMAYYMLKDYLDSDGKSTVDPILKPILDVIGPPSELTDEERLILDSYLFRDLVEYPFTYNTSLINSFDEIDVLNTNIVPNK